MRDKPISKPTAVKVCETEKVSVSNRRMMTSSIIQRNNHDEPTVQTAKTAAPDIEIAKSPG
jgi:hypothetical protein